jgi:hypothetical protein
MQANPLVALDLPLKALVWGSADQTNISYPSRSGLASNYELSAELACGLTGIETVTDAVLTRSCPRSHRFEAGSRGSERLARTRAADLARRRLSLPGQNPIRADEVACVAVRVSLEVVLMLGLGFPEWSCRHYLGHDFSGPAPRGVDVGDCLLGDATLLLIEVEDRRAIARPEVVALAVHGRRVVDLEEELEQVAIRGQIGIEHDLDRLGMRAVVAVGRIWNVASGVAHPSRDDSALLPEEILHSPEAASGQDRFLKSSVHASKYHSVRLSH